MKKNVEKRIKETVDNKTQPGVTINYKRLVTGKSPNAGVDNYFGSHVPGDLSAPRDHSWIEAMRKFREAIMTLHETLKNEVPERVKVSTIPRVWAGRA